MFNKYKGILLCLLISIPAWFLGKSFSIIGGPVFSIIIGIILALFIKNKRKNLDDGIKFVSKKVLQYAVILLGFGLNLQIIIKVGKSSLPVIISTIFISLIIAYFLSKAIDIPKKIAILIGVGSSICGGSAIAATAPIIDADSDEIAQAISVIFMFNVIAAIIFPTLGGIIGLSNDGFAIFAGTAVNDTSSVTAAASAWDNIHRTGTAVLDSATVVKLTRTLAIIPITFALSVYEKKQKAKVSEDSKTYNKRFNVIDMVPRFILYFILCSIFTTIAEYFISSGAISQNVGMYFDKFFVLMKNTSKFMIIMAMGAIGLNTDIVKLVKSGRKPILLGLSCWIGIIIMSLISQKLVGLL